MRSIGKGNKECPWLPIKAAIRKDKKPNLALRFPKIVEDHLEAGLAIEFVEV